MTATRPFVHLHCHSQYSMLDGANRLPDLIEKVKAEGMNSVAITDHGNLYGAFEFYELCREEGIKPIVGYEAYVAPGNRRDRGATKMKEASFHLTLLAMNKTGYFNLVKLASLAYLEGFYYRPRIDKETLTAYSEGLICLSGCAASELSQHILGGRMDDAKRLIEWYVKTFGAVGDGRTDAWLTSASAARSRPLSPHPPCSAAQRSRRGLRSHFSRWPCRGRCLALCRA